MGSYQPQRSKWTARIEPHIREWKTYKKEKAAKHLKCVCVREREMGKRVSVDERSKY